MNSSCPDRGFSCGRYRAIDLIFCFPSEVVIELASSSSCESVNCWKSCDGIIGNGRLLSKSVFDDEDKVEQFVFGLAFHNLTSRRVGRKEVTLKTLKIKAI